MSPNTEKMIGYVMFCIGLICILYASYAMYNVFTNATKPPEIFQMKSLSFLVSSAADGPSTVINFALDSEARKVVNLFLYSLFMFFIVMAGSKISALGIQFIKEIKVEMKS